MSSTPSQALEHILAERYQQAWDLLESEGARTPYLNALRGHALVGLNRGEQARRLFDSAITEDPDCAEALAGRGLLCLAHKELQTAAHDLRAAVRKEPGVGRFHAYYGHLLAETGELEQAVKELEAAFRMKHRGPTELLVLARLHTAFGRHQRALEVVEAVEQRKVTWTSQWSKATILLQLGRPREALLCFRHALKKNPGSPKLWRNYLRAVATHSFPSLLKEAERALTHHPDNENLTAFTANLYREIGMLDQAHALIQGAQARNPQSAFLLSCLGDHYRATGARMQAAAAYQRALSLQPDCHQAWFGKGRVTREPEKAALSLAKAVSLAPGHLNYHRELGLALLQAGRLSQAEEALREAVRLGPGEWSPRHHLGLCLLQQNRAQEALETLQLALGLEPDNPETTAALQRAQEALEKLPRTTEEVNQRFLAVMHATLDTFSTILPCLRREPGWSELDQSGVQNLAGDYTAGLLWLFTQTRGHGWHPDQLSGQALDMIETVSQELGPQPDPTALARWLAARHLPRRPDQGVSAMADFLERAFNYLLADYHGRVPSLERVDWAARDRAFRNRVRDLGQQTQFVTDFQRGLYLLNAPTEQDTVTRLVCDLTLLGSYDLQDRWLLMGWACYEIPQASRPVPLMGVPGEFSDISQEEAQLRVLECGSRLGVETLLNFPTSARTVLLLGLGPLREPEEKEKHRGLDRAQVAQDVQALLDGLVETVSRGETNQIRSALDSQSQQLRAHAHTLLQGGDASDAVSELAGELQTLSQGLQDLSTRELVQRLRKLRENWS